MAFLVGRTSAKTGRPDQLFSRRALAYFGSTFRTTEVKPIDIFVATDLADLDSANARLRATSPSGLHSCLSDSHGFRGSPLAGRYDRSHNRRRRSMPCHRATSIRGRMNLPQMNFEIDGPPGKTVFGVSTLLLRVVRFVGKRGAPCEESHLDRSILRGGPGSLGLVVSMLTSSPPHRGTVAVVDDARGGAAFEVPLTESS